MRFAGTAAAPVRTRTSRIPIAEPDAIKSASAGETAAWVTRPNPYARDCLADNERAVMLDISVGRFWVRRLRRVIEPTTESAALLRTVAAGSRMSITSDVPHFNVKRDPVPIILKNVRQAHLPAAR